MPGVGRDADDQPLSGPTTLAGVARRLVAEHRFTEGIIAIDGPSGAGKSTLADLFVAELTAVGVPAVLIRTDDFATWDDPAAWWPELERDILGAYERRHDYEYRPRVWSDGTASPGPSVWLRWQPLLIIEGVTAARRGIADRLTHAFWLGGPDRSSRLERSVARDGEAERPLLAAWQDFEDGWFAIDGTAARCTQLPSRTLAH